MNTTTISSLTLNAIVAATVLAFAPLAKADKVSEGPQPQALSSSLSIADVRAEAIAARDALLASGKSVESRLDPSAAPFTSTLSRAQVHAEAVESARLGLNGSYDGKAKGTAEQWAQIRRAGALAAGDMMAAAKQ